MTDKILGVWTQEEFKDVIVYAVVVAIFSFFGTVFFQWISKYLKET